jgi:hypothetical protein
VLVTTGRAMAAGGEELSNDAYRVRLESDRSFVVTHKDGASRKFTPRFTVLVADGDPKIEMRWGEFADPAMTLYNVSTWQTNRAAKADGAPIDPNAHVEDGFDPKSDRGADAGRTANYFRAAPNTTIEATSAAASNGKITFAFAANEKFELSATLDRSARRCRAAPVVPLHAESRGQVVLCGYTGAPESDPKQIDEAWQPLVWQEKRFRTRRSSPSRTARRFRARW